MSIDPVIVLPVTKMADRTGHMTNQIYSKVKDEQFFVVNEMYVNNLIILVGFERFKISL